MKKLITFGLAGLLCVCSAVAQTTNVVTWNAPISVTQTAAAVRLDQIIIVVMPTGKASIIVRWSWLGAAGNVLRNGTSTFTEDEIAAKLVTRGTSIEQLRELFLSIAQEEAVK